MKYRPTIQKGISFFLLLVFVIGTAPKLYLHDALANHKDSVTVCTHPFPNAPCLHQSPVNCRADLLVITSFYLFHAELPILYLQPQSIAPGSFLLASYSFLHHALTESRGPPAAARS